MCFDIDINRFRKKSKTLICSGGQQNIRQDTMEVCGMYITVRYRQSTTVVGQCHSSNGNISGVQANKKFQILRYFASIQHTQKFIKLNNGCTPILGINNRNYVSISTCSIFQVKRKNFLTGRGINIAHAHKKFFRRLKEERKLYFRPKMTKEILNILSFVIQYSVNNLS